jgi:hypothetical protein
MLSFAAMLFERHALTAALIGCARKMRAQAANWRHAVIASLTDPYRPELHYMRGPGPKFRAKARRIAASRSLQRLRIVPPTIIARLCAGQDDASQSAPRR